MEVPRDAQSAALLAHVASQLQLNVSFLESQNYLSAEDARNMRQILSRLPAGVSQSVVKVSPVPRAVPPAPIIPLPPTQQGRFVKAIWAYNEDGTESNDLSFSAGELVEVVSEKNQDWWLGRARGREALFPSNHVEKINVSSLPQPDEVATTTKKPYRQFGAAFHGIDNPPAVGTGVNSVGLQEASGQVGKKNKFGKYGNTLAHSAAGGAGFGAGAAIGGGLVRAIF